MVRSPHFSSVMGSIVRAALGFEVPNRVCNNRCRNFKSVALVLHKSPHGHLAVIALKDVALIVRGDALAGSELGRRFGNEGRDLAVLDAADPDAALETGIAGLIGLGVSHVH